MSTTTDSTPAEAWAAAVAAYEAQERSADTSDAGNARASRALARVLKTPAPDLAAVLYKLRLEAAGGASGAVLSAIADLERLGAGASGE